MLVFDSTGYALVTRTTITGLNVGSTYLVTATSTNIIGEGLPCSPLTVYAGTIPSKVLNITLASSTTTSLYIVWNFPESNGGLSLTQYTVYLDVGQTGSFT